MDIPYNKTNRQLTNQKGKGKSIWKRRAKTESSDPTHILKVWIWVYFFLWVFEGSLRKWILPGLQQPLLVIRDPIVLWLIILSSKQGLLKPNIYFTGIVCLGVISLFTAVVLGHGNIWVAIYGARMLLLYFPMIFVIGRVFNRDDVLRMGEIIVKMAIPMTLLLGLQFFSPQSAWVNRGVGGDEAGSGFSGAMGFFRSSCTFSFATGTVLFYGLVAPFLLYFWLNPGRMKQTILIGATGALIIAIPLSISRGLFFQIAVTIIFLLIAISRNPKYFSKIFLATFFVLVALILFSQLSFFKTASMVFTERFEGANESEGGMVQGVLGDRFFGQLFKAIMGAQDQSIFGYGIGSGTPLGATLLNSDKVSQLSDFEWMREIGELGLMGLFVIGIRAGLSLKIAIASYRKLALGDMLPWLLMSIGILAVAVGAWHQPTALGYFSLVGGLWLASFRGTGKRKNNTMKSFSRKDIPADNLVQAKTR